MERSVPSRLLGRVRRFVRARRKLPPLEQQLFLLGAQKAGTTALHSYLVRHPAIVGADLKEIGYFSREAHFQRGPDWYRQQFPSRMTGRWAVDSTPEYLYYRRCLPRIREVARDARFVVVLREPVARAYSAYNMYLQILGQPHFETRLAQNPRLEQFFGPLRDGGASPDIRTFLERELALIGADGPDVDEEPSLIRRGLYHRQIRRFVDAFGADRVLVLWSDELKRAPREVVGRVHAFLGIGPPDERDDFPEVHARAYDASTGADEGKARLRELAGSLFAADRAALVADGWTPPW